MNYYIASLHCKECAEELEDKINKSQSKKVVEVDYENSQLQISKDTDIQSLNKVLDFEKVIYSASKPEQAKDSSHESNHGHSHSHSYSRRDLAERNTKIVFFLNAIFAVAEFIFGSLFNSAALLSDAVHDTGDALSIGLAWLFQKMSLKEADEEYTFGYQRFSPLGAVVTAVVLIVGSVLVIFYSIPLLFNPDPVNYRGLFWIALIAIAIKLFCMYLMGKGSSQNEKLLNLHMLEDVVGWIAVLIVSVVLHFTDWYILDPLLSIGIAVFILYEAVPMFNETAKIFLETTPEGIDVEKLFEEILEVEEVTNISHLHVWTFDGEENLLTVTLSTQELDSKEHERIKDDIRKILFPHNITHSTIEVVVDEKGILKK